MSQRFTIEDGRWGPQMVLHSSWSDDVGGYMEANGIKELMINYARGFVGDDISFVTSLPELEGLWIIHRTIDDIAPIHALHELRSLKIDTYCGTPVDFSQFPRLEHCYLEWREGVHFLFGLTRLEELWLNGYGEEGTDDFGRLQTLRALWLSNAKTSDLRGLADLEDLRELGLYRLRRLRNLHGLESLASLRTLELQECGNVESLDPVCSLTELRRLLLVDLGSVASIRCLAGLTQLEEVLFYGSTNVSDGDLSCLTRLPNLENVSFQNRRHYTHRREEFEQY